MRIIRALNYHLPWIFMMGLITLESELSGAMLGPALIKGLDKVIHFLIFGVLGWLMARGFSNSSKAYVRRNFSWLIILVAFSFAVLDEVHQSMIPGRSPDVWDWIADVSGIVIFMFWYKKRYPVKN